MISNEKTLVIIKPDIIKNPNWWKITGEIIKLFEKQGLKMVRMKMVRLTPQLAKNFYQEHSARPFFKGMTEFMASSPVVVICWAGPQAIKLSREIIGATNPVEAETGTIRKIFGTSIEANAVHGSDSPSAAEREINFFFSTQELFLRPSKLLN